MTITDTELLTDDGGSYDNETALTFSNAGGGGFTMTVNKTGGSSTGAGGDSAEFYDAPFTAPVRGIWLGSDDAVDNGFLGQGKAQGQGLDSETYVMAFPGNTVDSVALEFGAVNRNVDGDERIVITSVLDANGNDVTGSTTFSYAPRFNRTEFDQGSRQLRGVAGLNAAGNDGGTLTISNSASFRTINFSRIEIPNSDTTKAEPARNRSNGITLGPISYTPTPAATPLVGVGTGNIVGVCSANSFANIQPITFAGGAGTSADGLVTTSINSGLFTTDGRTDRIDAGNAAFTLFGDAQRGSSLFFNRSQLDAGINQTYTQSFTGSEAGVLEVYIHFNSLDQIGMFFNPASNPGMGWEVLSNNTDTQNFNSAGQAASTTAEMFLLDQDESDQDRSIVPDEVSDADGLSADFSVRLYRTDGGPISSIQWGLRNDPVDSGLADGFQFVQQVCAPMPEIDLGKGAAVIAQNADGTSDVRYTFVAQNTGDATLTDLSLVDNLDAQLGSAFTASTQSDTTGGVLVGPTVSLTNTSGTSTAPTPDTTGYDGTGDMLNGTSGSLAPGDAYTVTITVRIDPNAAGVPASFENTATASGTAPGGANPVTDVSDTDTAPDGSPDGTPNQPGEPVGVPTVVTLQTPTGAIGVVKSSVFNDESGDGNAQVGETITFIYTVTNEGAADLSNVTLTETGFAGVGTAPTPTLQPGGDANGDTILQTTETWTYQATYALLQGDIDAGMVDNSATAAAEAPDGTPVNDVSDSSNPNDGDGTGTPGPGAPNDEVTSTPLTEATIVAENDVRTDVLDATNVIIGAIDIFADNGNGADMLNGATTDSTAVTVAADPTNPVPTGLTLNADGSVDVAAGTAAGTYTFGYEICEIGNTTNCDLATVTLTIGAGGIGVVKSSVFNDQSGDGNAQVGETITYTYTVTNLGDLDLSTVTLTESGFAGVGTAPTPVLQPGGDANTDAILQTTETWIYLATYALEQGDIDAGMVDNSATAAGETPDGTPVSDISDSQNPNDGDGSGTPGPGGPNDEVTSTPLTSTPIDALNDVVADPLDASNDIIGAVSIFDDNGAGIDTLDGVATDSTAVTVTEDPANPVPTGLTLNSDGSVDVAAGTAAGPYTFGYEICEIGNTSNCDIATVTLTIGEGDIGVIKGSTFNDENGDGFGQVGETITYTYTVTNPGDFDLSTVTLIETGFAGVGTAPTPVLQPGGDANTDTILQTTETWTYEATYALEAGDLTAGNVDNQATVAAETPNGGNVDDLSDSTNATDGDGTGTPGDGADNDDPTATPLTSAPITARDDTATNPVEGVTGQTGVLSVFDNNGAGGDTLNSAPATVTNTTVVPNTTSPPPTGITLNTDGTVDVAAGTVPGTYSFDYDLCETANPNNCDTATVTLTVLDGAIGVVKSSVFDDQSGDGNAQVGETITYTYTVTNEGELALSTVTLTETGFTGVGTPPTPLLQSGDNGDNILQPTEIWIYTASYALQQADIDAGQVDNSATAAGVTPGGTPVTDISDSQNPADGDGTGTPGDDDPTDDELTSTPLSSSTIVAQNDVEPEPLDANTNINGAINVFTDSGAGLDTLNGTPTNSTQVTVVEDPTNPVPAGLTLNPDGTVDVAAGTAPGPYTFGYEICEIGNTNNCDTATVTLTIGEGGIGIVKSSTFNDELVGDGNGQIGETISYSYSVTNTGNLPLDTVSVTETGFTGNGTPPTPVFQSGDDGDALLEVGETWIYTATYSLIASDLTDGVVDNQATATGDTPGGARVTDLSDSTNPTDGDGTGTPGDGAGNDDPNSEPLGSAPIVAEDDTLTPPLDTTSPLTAVLNIFDDNGAGPDTLNGLPTNNTAAMVEVVATAPPPAGITLNPDGTVDVAAGTPPATYTFDYQICEILNPANCDDATVTLTVGAGQIAVVKNAVFNDESGDGNGQIGETITYTYTVTNPGQFDLSNPTLTETGFAGVGAVPTPVLQPGGDANGDGILQTTETWIYSADYTLEAGDLAAGMVDNQATATGETPGGTPVSDLSDSTNPGDGDGVGRPDSGPGNDDPNSTPFTDATIAANDDIIADPLDATNAIPAVLNVLTATGTGAEDSLNGTPTNTGEVTISEVTPATPIGGGPVPVLNPATGDVDVPAGTPGGTYQIVYQICETLNPTNCDTATAEVTVGVPSIGILKQSSFNDENFDGFGQVGETITYTYTVTNEGNLPLGAVNVTETAAGFTGAGTLPTPAFVGGDDGNGLLETGEIWFYSATYALVAADLTAGQVDNLAEVAGNSPDGTPVSDLSDSSNPGDGNGTATPGDGAGNDDPTVTPLPSAPIVAEDDSVTGIDGFNGQPDVMNVLSDNGGGSDTLGGTPTTTSNVTISVVTPATPIGGAPVPVLNSTSGAVDVPPGTPAGTYQITYEICETLNPANCDEAVATVTVTPPAIDAVNDDFTATPFDGENGGTTPTVFTNDTLDTFPFADTAVTVAVTDEGGLTGVTINPDGTINVPPGTPAGTYPVTYEICDALNPTNCDPAIATILVGTILAQPETFATISGDTGGVTMSILGSDLLSGAPITNPSDVTITVTGATGGLTLDPATNGILVPPNTPAGSYTLTYQICDVTNPAICSTTTETVVVGTIVAVAETFPPTAGGQTTAISVLDSDLLNGNPATTSTVSLTLVTTDPALTLNPDGTITIAAGTAAGDYALTYEICDLANPAICSQITETVSVIPEPSIVAVKTQVLVDNGDGLTGTGDRLDYTITLTNDGNVVLANVTPTDTLTNGNGTVLTLDAGPTFASSSSGSPEGTLQIGESATYTASYTLQNDDVNSGFVSNVVLANGSPVAPAGYVGPPLTDVQDQSDEGNPANGQDDPTVFSFSASAFVDGLTIRKTAGVSTAQRGGVVPYTIEITNANPAAAIAGVTVDTLPRGFVYVDGSATINGVPSATVDVAGRVISFPTLIVPAGGTATVMLTARVLTGAPAGDAVNTADLLDAATGAPLAPSATATVRIQIEPVFDCGDVIGKVFDDQNGNGYQDQGEPGLPAVRIAGVDGTIITTDQYGRYHVPCAVLPETRGSNFILKVDERSLPTGYRITTENPRVIRLTRGKMKELNFGASISQIVRVDINSRVYGMDETGKMVLVPAFKSGMERLLTQIKDQPSTVRIAFHLPKDATDAHLRTGRKMSRDVKRYIRQRWRRIGDYKLNIETTIVRRK